MHFAKLLIFLAFLILLQARPHTRKMNSRRSSYGSSSSSSGSSSSSYDSPNSLKRRSNGRNDDGKVNSYQMKNNFNGYDDTSIRRRRRRANSDIDTTRLRHMLDRKIANRLG